MLAYILRRIQTDSVVAIIEDTYPFFHPSKSNDLNGDELNVLKCLMNQEPPLVMRGAEDELFITSAGERMLWLASLSGPLQWQATPAHPGGAEQQTGQEHNEKHIKQEAIQRGDAERVAPPLV